MSNTLNISIEAPITEHCKECDYEKHYSFGSMRCHCPECETKNSIQRGPRINKERLPIRAWVSQGNYNWIDENDISFCYSFYNLPKDFEKTKNSFIIDDEFETDDPIELCREIKDYYENKMLFSSSKDDFMKLYDMICTEENEELQYQLRQEHRKVKLETELYQLYKEMGLLK